MLLRGFRLFGVALHREPKGTKRERNSHTVPTGLAFQLQSIAIVAYQWEPPSNGSATQESTVAQSYVC